MAARVLPMLVWLLAATGSVGAMAILDGVLQSVWGLVALIRGATGQRRRRRGRDLLGSR